MSADREILLHVPPAMWRDFSREMKSQRHGRDEALGIMLCTRHRVGTGRTRLLPRVWAVPSRGCYDYQSPGGLALDTRVDGQLLSDYLKPGMDVVHVHTHPGKGVQMFSSVDDANEAAYSRALAALPGRPRLFSGVFDADMSTGTFRIWRGGSARARFCPDLLDLPESVSLPEWAPEVFDRQRVFGDPFQQQLGAMRVGLVGISGIGIPFLELLARLGVRDWVMVDDDVIEPANLNRLLFATHRMAEQQLPKVDLGKLLVKRAWPRGSRVRAMKTTIEDPAAKRELAGCDLIVVATDNHYSRMVAQRIALRHVRPLLSLGTGIDTRGGDVRMFTRVTLPPLDGGWCLNCSRVIDPTEAAMEQADPRTRQVLKARGYVDDVHAPAVAWLNVGAAQRGARVVHGLVTNTLDIDSGIDWVTDESDSTTVHLTHERNDSCFHCSPDADFAAGPEDEHAGRTTVVSLLDVLDG